MHYINKLHFNKDQVHKIWGAIALIGALLAFLLILAGVASTDSYSIAAQAQASGDPLMQLSLGDADAAGNNNVDGHDHETVQQ